MQEKKVVSVLTQDCGHGAERSKISSMRRLALAALLLAACSSSAPTTSEPKASVTPPEFSIEQTSGPAEAGYVEGPFEVKYRLEIANHADVPLTLKRLTISTVNPAGGAYTLTAPHDYYFNKDLAPKSTEEVEFWARAYGYGRSMRDTEPVTVKGVAYFQAPGGTVTRVFVRELSQYQ